MDDAAPRFRDKYILKTISYNVPEGARRWYVRHTGVFIKAQSGRRLSTLTADDIEHYLKGKGGSEKLAGWQFRQMVDALRILFTGVVSSAWASNFDWAGWMKGVRELPADHATIARHAITALERRTFSGWPDLFCTVGSLQQMKFSLTRLHLIWNTFLSIVMLRPIHRVSLSMPSFNSHPGTPIYPPGDPLSPDGDSPCPAPLRCSSLK